MDPQTRGNTNGALVMPATSAQAGSQHFRNRLDEIWECLMDYEVSLIGICGMGGIGKTTLAQHIHSRALVYPSTFSHVYWVSVSRMYGVGELQDNISQAMGFDISFERDEMKRAAIFSTKLMTRKEPRGCVLIILDDLWYFIRLQELGIPEKMKGCKMIVTSRSFDMCLDFGCQKIYKVDIITDEEAWDLFLNNIGRSALDHPIEQIARKIVTAYRSLPFAIISSARSLRNAINIQEWENAYQSIVNSNEDDLFQVLKLCYNRLNDPKVQQCFLYCALYLEDHLMDRDKLIHLLIAEDLIYGVSLEEKLDRGNGILNKLIDSALLQEGIDILFVKMHPLIRDMALKILAGDNSVIIGSFSIQNSSTTLPDSGVVACTEWRVTILGTSIQSFHLQVMLEWIFVLINLILETLSAFFDQISSPERPQYSLIGVVMSFAALLICIVELGHRVRKERAIWRQCWFYYPCPSNRPLGTFAENFGLICAICQCLSSAIQYVYFSRHADNPLKLSAFPIILAGYLVYLQFAKMR